MKKSIATILGAMLAMTGAHAQSGNMTERALWATIAKKPSSGDLTTNDTYKGYYGKVLVNWRMLPSDDENTGFDLYRKIGAGVESQLNRKISFTGGMHYEVTPITATNYQDDPSDKNNDITYRLTYTGSDETLGTFTLTRKQMQDGLPYISIPLQPTDDVYANPDEFEYQANDASVGDLDGDGQMEIVVKRLVSPTGHLDGGTGASDSDPKVRHTVIFDAYKLDGTLLWRVKSGPNIILGNSINFGVADLDGDGCAEVVTKTGEGTVFGDGKEIGDTNGDGKTYYRSVWPVAHYTGDGPKGYGGPEFFSVIDGKTGRELARANFINRAPEGQTEQEMVKNWDANDRKWDNRTNRYAWKLANSLRLGIASFDGKKNHIFLGRGVYARSVVEGWNYEPVPSGEFEGTLTRLWHFDTDEAGGKDTNKDGKLNSAYAAQGNHAFNATDLDGDGCDEIMYGSCAFDNDGTGLWTSGLGHGDANHVGKFLPDREGLQVFHCLENGIAWVALHDAKDGKVIWQRNGTSSNDMGRCMVDDIDPNSPGCEFWWPISSDYSAYAYDGNKALGYKPSSCNMAVWFDGTLNRQLMNENIINNDRNGGRVFTMYRYSERFINGTKSNPSWYGDMLGDWREEVIVPDGTLVGDLKVFTTWYPTEHRFPWLMTDHNYYMQCVNECVGYNQPTHTGFYLGSDLKSDREAWEAFQQQNQSYLDNYLNLNQYKVNYTSGIVSVSAAQPASSDLYYMIDGRRSTTKPAKGMYIYKGRKYISH